MNERKHLENNQPKKKTRGLAKKTPVNKAIFNRIIYSCGYSVRKLGSLNEIPCTEKTIRRSLNEGRMNPEFLDAIAKHINVKPELLSGELHQKAESYEDDAFRKVVISTLTKEKYPYYTKRKQELWSFSENGFVENILSLYNVAMSQFNELEFEKQYQFQHDLIDVITPIMFNYFTKDAYGHDAYPDFYKPQFDLEDFRDNFFDRQYADTTLREKFIRNPPRGYSVEQIRRMSPDKLIDLDMDLHDSDSNY